MNFHSFHFRRPLFGLLAVALAGVRTASAQPAAPVQDTPIFYIREYRVSGFTKLDSLEIQETVYPFLGPARTAEDVEKARLALEKAVHDKGFDTVSVLIPQQDPRFGVIRFEVVEGKVGRFRVNGAKWYRPSRIKQEAPSIEEGTVPNFNEVRKDLVNLNRQTDRKVTPDVRPGIDPGTVDIDLNVEDKLPLHGSIELNNQYTADTTKLRLNGALSYGNLFQRGDTIGGSFQVAPENPDDALVYSGYYLSRINDHLSLKFQAMKNESDIASLGGASTIGKGETYSLHALFDLPSQGSFTQTFSLGADYKDLQETTILGDAPVEYILLSASYGASWLKDDHFTALNLSANLNLRGLGSEDSDFASRRYKARGSFLYLRGDVSHTRDLKNGMQLFGKLQGQLASGPLINSEQFSGGGLGSARGYLEASALGDNGLFATLEARSPSFTGVEDKDGKRADEWRIHAFLDGGVLGIYDALPGQESTTTFASAGFGTRFKFKDHYNGSVDLAFPLLDQATTDAFDPFLSFRGWADF